MNMFKPNPTDDPKEYIAQIDEPRRSQIEELHHFIQKHVPKSFTPYMQSGMIGYGKYHYKTKAGVEGEWFIIGLASNKNYISVYVSASENHEYIAERYKEALPKANIGRSCIRFKKLEDIDLKALGQAIKEGVEVMKDQTV